MFLFPFVSVSGDVYSNSFISPNSASDLEGSERPELPVDVTSGPSEITNSRLSSLTASETFHTIQKRSAAPILSSSIGGIDDLLSSKNVGESLESNDVELSGKVVSFIQPSRTISRSDAYQTDEFDIRLSGEGPGTPQVSLRFFTDL